VIGVIAGRSAIVTQIWGVSFHRGEGHGAGAAANVHQVAMLREVVPGHQVPPRVKRFLMHAPGKYFKFIFADVGEV